MPAQFNSVPSDRDLNIILAIAISQHPHVQNAVILDPTRPAEPVKIEKLKLYGGRELTEAGLVLGIYPDKVGLGNSMQGFMKEQPLSIASNQAQGATFLTEAYFVAQLSYRVTDFDTPVTVKYGQSTQNLGQGVGPTEHLLFGPENYQYGSYPSGSYQEESLEVVVLPAEEVLKDWTTVLRYVIRDIRYLHPYRVRSPQIISVSYDTSEIFSTAARENLVFHTSSIHFKLMYTEGNFDR
jgi:hypothetical protein